jgi:hypothetical protein
MSLIATCQCGRQYHVKDSHAGRTAKCPACGAAMAVPRAAAAPVDEVWPPMPEPTSRATPAPQAMHPPEMMAAPEMTATAVSGGGRGKLWAILIVVVLLGGGAFGAWQAGWLGQARGTAATPAGPPAPTTPGGALITRISSPDPTAVAVEHPQPIELKTKFVPGLYDLSESSGTRLTVQITAEGKTINVGSKDKTTIGGDVQISAPDATGEQLVRFTCRSIRMTTESEAPGKPPETMSYDSEGPPEAQRGMLADIMAPMIGWEGSLWCRDGKYTRTDGVEQLMQRIRMSASPQASQMMGKLEKMMGEFLKEMLTQHYGEVLPRTPVAPGARWKAQIKLKAVPMLGPMDVDCECMLHRIERGQNGADVAVIGFSCVTRISDRDMKLSEMMPGAPPAHISYMNITHHGVFYFDTGIGLSTRVGVEANISGAITMRQRGEEATMNLSGDIEANNVLSRNTSGARPPPALRRAAGLQPTEEADQPAVRPANRIEEKLPGPDFTPESEKQEKVKPAAKPLSEAVR